MRSMFVALAAALVAVLNPSARAAYVFESNNGTAHGNACGLRCDRWLQRSASNLNLLVRILEDIGREGLDVSSYVSSSQFSCLANNGLSFAIVRAYHRFVMVYACQAVEVLLTRVGRALQLRRLRFERARDDRQRLGRRDQLRRCVPLPLRRQERLGPGACSVSC